VSRKERKASGEPASKKRKKEKDGVLKKLRSTITIKPKIHIQKHLKQALVVLSVPTENCTYIPRANHLQCSAYNGSHSPHDQHTVSMVWKRHRPQEQADFSSLSKVVVIPVQSI
jgi:hypothetical protein